MISGKGKEGDGKGQVATDVAGNEAVARMPHAAGAPTAAGRPPSLVHSSSSTGSWVSRRASAPVLSASSAASAKVPWAKTGDGARTESAQQQEQASHVAQSPAAAPHSAHSGRKDPRSAGRSPDGAWKSAGRGHRRTPSSGTRRDTLAMEEEQVVQEIIAETNRRDESPRSCGRVTNASAAHTHTHTTRQSTSRLSPHRSRG